MNIQKNIVIRVSQTCCNDLIQIEECFKFDHPKGLINSKSKKKVNITFKPTLRHEFDIDLVCYARDKLTKEL